MLEAGYSQAIITPALERPVFLAGFGQNRRARAVHDDLYVRALALRTNQVTVVLVAVDLVGFFHSDAMSVIQRVKAKAHDVEVIIAATHTHHGPDTMGLWGPDSRHSGVDPAYMAALRERISTTILFSLHRFQPVKLKSACVRVRGVARNGRDPGVVDDELTVAQFFHPQTERPVVTLLDFPCHPEVLAENNTRISADYPGVLLREVGAATRAPCIFFAGALGGMMTPDVSQHSFEEMERMGGKLSQAGLNALVDAPMPDISPSIALKKVEIATRLTNTMFKLAFRRKLLPDVRNSAGEIVTEVNLLKIGSLWLASVPGELLPKLGMALKTSMRQAGAKTAGIIGLANDELGYILPVEDFRYPINPFSPGRHYEETMSVSREIGPMVVEAVQSMLK